MKRFFDLGGGVSIGFEGNGEVGFFFIKKMIGRDLDGSSDEIFKNDIFMG